MSLSEDVNTFISKEALSRKRVGYVSHEESAGGYVEAF